MMFPSHPNSTLVNTLAFTNNASGEGMVTTKTYWAVISRMAS